MEERIDPVRDIRFEAKDGFLGLGLGLGLIGGFLCAGLPQRSQGAGSMSHPHPSKEPHPKSWVP